MPMVLMLNNNFIYIFGTLRRIGFWATWRMRNVPMPKGIYFFAFYFCFIFGWHPLFLRPRKGFTYICVCTFCIIVFALPHSLHYEFNSINWDIFVLASLFFFFVISFRCGICSARWPRPPPPRGDIYIRFVLTPPQFPVRLVALQRNYNAQRLIKAQTGE